MIISIEKNQKRLAYRILSAFVAFVFMFSMVVPPSSAQMIPQMFSLPSVGTMITMTPEYVPAVIKGLTLYPDNPLMFDFIIDTGDSNLTGDALEDESTKLIKYFLAALTVPENDMWVNLSPYEGNRIIPESFGVTEMGRDLLGQDYLLKQLTASLMYPEDALGSEFWERVYEKAEARFGTRDIPMNTFNKIWIVPENATVYEQEGSAFVVKSHLRVMLEEDYIALNENIDSEKFGMKDLLGEDAKIASGVTSEIVKEILIPEIEQEVNNGKTFANLRQIYNSMILATWYKMNLKDSLLGRVYVDQNKIKGVDIEDVDAKQKIYDQYIEAFKEGVYNYIKEDYDPATQQIIPRKYFSGGAMPVSQGQVRDNLIQGAPVDLSASERDVVTEGLARNSERSVVVRVSEVNVEQTRNTDPNEIAQDANDTRKDTSMLATPYEIEAAIEYTRTRQQGEASTAPIPGDFRGSLKEDVVDITEISQEEALRLEKIGMLAVLRGKGYFSTLIAGASSRMNVLEAPQEVRDMVQGKELKSKAAVPVGIVDGEVHTYLDVFGINVKRLLESVREEAQAVGISENVDGNKVLFLSNDEYRQEHDALIADSNNYGLNNEQIRFFHQPLGAKFYATVRDVTELIALGTIKEGQEAALAKAREVEAEIAKGNREAVIAPGERDPLGHGDYFHQMVQSGELLYMLENNVEWGFVRNIDNNAGKFDKIFLRELGLFIDQQLDFQPEVSPRAAGQVGGSLVIRPDGNQVIGEDPNLLVSKDAEGNLKADPAKNYWMNSAAGFFTPKYVAVQYMEDGQTLPEFIEEMRQAKNDQEAMGRIAARGKRRALALVAPKESKLQKGVYVGKRETNMWMSSAVVDSNKVKIRAVGVKGAGNLDINRYLEATEQEKQEILAAGRFLATKQWDVEPAKVEATRKKLTAAFMADPAIGREPTDAELAIRLESYEGNKLLAEGYLNYIFSGELVTPGLIEEGDAAMLTEVLPLKNVNEEGARKAKFGTSGDRWQWTGEGSIDTISHVRRLATGIARNFNEVTPGKIMLIGFDPRHGNVESARETAKIYAANGIKVRIVSAESTPAPVLAWLTNTDPDIGGDTILTASHSPYTDIGLKVGPSHGGAASQQMTDNITKYANDSGDYKVVDYQEAVNEGLIEELSPEEVANKYVNGYILPKLRELGAFDDMVNFIKQNPDFELVVDPMQGTGVRYLRTLYDALSEAAGRNFYTMVNDNNNDDTFSDVNNEPNPTKEKSRARFVKEVNDRIATGKKVMGSSVDADSDRFGNVDTNGEFVSTNDMIALIAYFLKKEIGVEGAIGKTVATSNFVNAVADHLNVELDEEAVGFKHFVKNVAEDGRTYIVAGEESSHVAVGPFINSWDDGIVVGLMGLWITARTGKSLYEYKDQIQKEIGKKFLIETITRRKDIVKDTIVAKRDKIYAEIADILQGSDRALSRDEIASLSLVQELEGMQDQKVADIVTKDGVKLVFESGDWILIRPSGTEPAGKAYVEVAAEYEASDAQMQEKFKNLASIADQIIGWETPGDSSMLAYGEVEEESTLGIEGFQQNIPPSVINRGEVGIFISGDTSMLSQEEVDWYTREIKSASTADQVDALLQPFDGRSNTGNVRALRILGNQRKQQIVGEDAEFAALLAQEESGKTPVGGIDLNPAFLDLQIKRDGKGIPLPMEVQDIDSMNIQGFTPVIINVTPIPSLPLILGFVPEDTYDYDEYASAENILDGTSALVSKKFWMKEIA